MIRGIEPVKRRFVGAKFTAAVPIATTAVTTSLVEGIRGEAFDNTVVPFHDHAYYGTRIPRSAVWVVDGGYMGAMGFTHQANNEWWAVHPNMDTLEVKISHAAGVVKDTPARIVGRFYIVGGVKGVTHAGGPPSVVGKIYMRAAKSKPGEALQAGGTVTLRFYNVSNGKYVDITTSDFSYAWRDIPPLEVVAGINDIMIFSTGYTDSPATHTAYCGAAAWTFTETEPNTQPVSGGSVKIGSEPRP